MSDEFDDLDNDDLQDGTSDEGRETNPARRRARELEKQNRELKAQLAAADKVAAEGAQAKRELMLKQAGVDTESGTGKLFLKSYDGEDTLDAIKAAAAEYGLIPTSQTAEVAAELAASQRVTQASAGASTPPPPPDIHAQIKGAKTPDEVVALAMQFGSSISNEEVTAADVRPLSQF